MFVCLVTARLVLILQRTIDKNKPNPRIFLGHINNLTLHKSAKEYKLQFELLFRFVGHPRIFYTDYWWATTVRDC